MAENQLLCEFASSNPGDLQHRLTEVFDSLIQESEDEVVTKLKTELERILEERINALSQD